ncbi:MAG: hypothetical protein JXB20_05585, partial [Bacilli bacterium]|nr:hypothetical protein [Bacilli bacterium]
MLVLENKTIKIGFSETNGSIIMLEDPINELNYVHLDSQDPFRLETNEGLTTSYTEFDFQLDGSKLTLTWQTLGSITVTSTVQLEPEGLYFRAKVDNKSQKTINSLEYPIIGGIDKITDDDHLIHSYATGFMVDDPFVNFINQGEGLRYMPYPESFSGASMQFFAYYGKTGGLYFAANDPDMHQKWLNFYKNLGYLEASHIYGYEDLYPGNNLEFPYTFYIRPFTGDWMDAADIYKMYASENFTWLPDKTAEREHPKWLYQNVGLATFGINAKHDRTKWLKQYHEDLESPIFHILGPDWTNEPQTFRRGIPGPIQEWIPTCFDKNNLEQISSNGDYYAPFEFDFYVRKHPEYVSHVSQFPKQPKSHDMYHFNMLCPCEDYTLNMHVQRDLAIFREAEPDAFYYDISSNNLIKTCMAENHRHKVGGGQEISKAYKHLYQETSATLKQEARRQIPLGTEMINEIHLE